MTENTSTPNLHYAAVLIKKMISPLAVADPTPDDFSRLSGPLYELAMAIYSEGRSKDARRKRLEAEARARGLELILLEIESANPDEDLAALQIKSGWDAIDLADVITEEIPPIQWLVKPFLSLPSVTVFFGKPKSMKSLLLLDMCLHVAGGFPWLISSPQAKDGLEVTPARVVWLDLENGSLTLKRRMKAIGSALGMGKTRGQLQAFSMPTPWPDLSKDENTAELINRLKALGDIGILVIDHLGQVFGGIDENSPMASQIMGSIRQISEACNLAIVLIHHAKKGQGKEGGAPEDQLRGSGAILAGVDAAFLVERDRAEKTQLKLIPVATRGPDAPNVSAKFSFDTDDSLDLTKARFWKMAWRSNSTRARESILAILGNGKKNNGELKSAVKIAEPGLSDGCTRDAINTLVSNGEICYTKGNKGAKIYQLAGENELEN